MEKFLTSIENHQEAIGIIILAIFIITSNLKKD